MADRQLKDKAIKFKDKDYVQVKDRIQYLVDNYDWKYSIDTEYEYFSEEKMRVVRATLTIGNCTFVWTAQEIEGSTYINKTSALENAETSAVWRACAMAWIWVIDSVASIDEINKANNRQAYIDKKAKDKEIMEDSPFKQEVKTDKPEFWEENFENLKLKMNMFDFDVARKTIHEKYNVWAEYEKKVMDLYGKNSWDLFN